MYVGLGTGGVIHYTSDRVHHGGWWYYKTLWAVAPDYTGPVVITGHQVNGPHFLRFNASGPIDQVLTKLRFPPVNRYEPKKWQYGPSSTLFRAPGCYTFKVQGRNFVQFVAFVARP